MRNIMIAGTMAILALPCFANPAGEARQQAFKKILRSFEPMGLMVRGREPYNKDMFIQHADTLKQIANEPFSLFVPNSIDAKSRAKPEIWSEPTAFKNEQEKFLSAVNQLDTAAHTANWTTIKKSFGDVAQSCKSCHDKFRGPER